jgi:predicted nuclease of predicted toxin-antitoxin system
VGQGGVRLFIALLATRLNDTGSHDAIHPLHVGRRGELDHRVLERCIAEDRVIVTQNARDFRRLAARTELHPGLIILPFMDRESTWHLLLSAIAFLDARGDPMNAMVNRALEVDAAARMLLLSIPAKGV